MNNQTENENSAVQIANISKSFGAAKILENINFEDDSANYRRTGNAGFGQDRFARQRCYRTSGAGTRNGRYFSKLRAFSENDRRKKYRLRFGSAREKKNEIAEKVKELLSLINLEEHSHKLPSKLSGGQQQRVAIARALAYEPEILLFDEPFGALDAQIRTRLRREIRQLLKKINVPSIFITHDQEEALELGDRIGVLNAGKLEQIGTPFDVYNTPETEFVATFLGAANLLIRVFYENKIALENTCLDAPPETREFRNGQSVKIVFRPEDVFLRKPENLTQNYQELAAGTIEEINFVGAFAKSRRPARSGGATTDHHYSPENRNFSFSA